MWIRGVNLHGADLGDLASAVAGALGLDRREVIVVDVRDDHVVVDVLRRTVAAERVIAREERLLRAMAAVPGVSLSPTAFVHSEGVLGLISVSEEQGRDLLERSALMAEQVRAKVARRAMVFASGPEVSSGMIKDTNTPYIVDALGRRGFVASAGGVLQDDDAAIAARFVEAAESGYGLIVSTGGVGAEDKDRTIEGLLRVDRLAATPWVVKYRKGTGRHVKEGVRIGVGSCGASTIAVLPGPNDEVRECLDELIACLESGEGKERTARRVAARLGGHLRRETRARSNGHDHHRG
ncbi:MAG: molybdopterin-binding protein [Firmicutes bacterium]|nr:molybdopterin-binding protein [Bacillota bacterium]